MITKCLFEFTSKSLKENIAWCSE